MEAIKERVGEPSSSRRTRPKQSRKSLAESPPSQLSRSSQKKRKRETTTSGQEEALSEEFPWKVKGILEQKYEKGQIHYLVDWAEDPKTGRSYKPTWEPHNYVNETAKQDWENEKTRKKLRYGSHGRGDSVHQSSSIDPDSQPIRTAKRRRLKFPSQTSSQRRSDKPRRAGTAETARFQSISQESVNSEGKPTEIKDTYEESSWGNQSSGRVRVEISVDEQFDREAYTKVPPSSESSLITPNSQLLRHSQPSNLSSQPSIRSSARLYIWDEDDTVPAVIPDSQDIHGSSSFVPSQTQRSVVETQLSRQSEFPTSSSSARGSALAPTSSDSSHQISRPLNDPFPKPTELSSSSVDAAELQSGRQQLRTPADRSQDSFILHSSNYQDLIVDSEAQNEARGERSSSATNIEPSNAGIDLQSPSPESFPLPSQSLSQLQSHQPAYSLSDDLSSGAVTSDRVSSSLNDGSTNRPQVPSDTQNDFGSSIGHHVSSSSKEDHSAIRLHSQTLPPISNSGALHEPTRFHTESLSSQTGLNNSPSQTRNSQHHEEHLESDSTISLSKPQEFHSPNEKSNPSRPLHLSGHSFENETVVDFSSRQPSQSHSSQHTSEIVLPSIESGSNISSSMADQMMKATEKMKLARADAGEKFAERFMAQQRERNAASQARSASEARSPSAIPHTAPPPPQPVNQMLPLRETAPDVPEAQPAEPEPTNISAEDDEDFDRGVKLLPLGQNVFTIPLAMVGLARDLYEQEFKNHRIQRKSFLEDETINATLVTGIEEMLERLCLICDHPDLADANSASQAMESDRRKAKWAENISMKCMFLAEFFKELKIFNDEHIVLLVRPGQMMDIFEAIFRTNDYRYSRPDRQVNQPGQGPLITLLPTNSTSSLISSMKPASLLLAFDSTFKNESWVDTLRRDPANLQRLAPLAYLVITNSIEHLELCLTKDVDDLNRKAILVSWLSNTRDEVGKLNSAYPSLEETVKSLAEFTTGTGGWPLPPMPSIEEIEMPELIPKKEHEAQSSGSTTQSYDASSPFKRPLLDDEQSESSKRQRVTPARGLESADNEVSQTQDIMSDSTKAEVIEDNSGTAPEVQVSALLRKVRQLELQLQSKASTEVDLRASNQRLELRWQDLDNSLARIQPKYQEALNDRGEFEHNIKESMARETSMHQKLNTRTTELAKVRDQKAILDTELSVAREALSSSLIPEVAELQRLKDELNAARLELEKTTKKLTNSQNDLEYMRENYRQASTAAAEMRNELDELKAQNTRLSQKASENAVEVHRIQASSEIKQYLQLISELEGDKAIVERELEKKNEELRSLQNGRRPTRGTSVPRSPRMGTMSPGQTTSRSISRVMGANSRGTSPAPGSSEGGFRGAAVFGDALFPAGGAPNRFGNHLS